jgi:hypothetical protein
VLEVPRPGLWLEVTALELVALLDWHRTQFLSDGVYALIDSDLATRIAALLLM